MNQVPVSYLVNRLSDGSYAVYRIEADREYALGIYPTRLTADDAVAADQRLDAASSSPPVS